MQTIAFYSDLFESDVSKQLATRYQIIDGRRGSDVVPVAIVLETNSTRTFEDFLVRNDALYSSAIPFVLIYDPKTVVVRTDVVEKVFSFVKTPFDETLLNRAVDRAVRLGAAEREVQELRKKSEKIGIAGLRLDKILKMTFVETLEACDNSRAKAARMLGVSERTVYNWLKKYKLN